MSNTGQIDSQYLHPTLENLIHPNSNDYIEIMKTLDCVSIYQNMWKYVTMGKENELDQLFNDYPGLDVNRKDPHNGYDNTALIKAARAFTENAKMTKYLINQRNADVNVRNRQNVTALITAATGTFHE